jgi:hypothetical protein
MVLKKIISALFASPAYPKTSTTISIGLAGLI